MHKEFPKWMFFRGGEKQIVADPDAEAALLAKGWAEHPSDVKDAPAPKPEPAAAPVVKPVIPNRFKKAE